MNDKQYDSLFGDEDTKEVIDLTKLEENDITKKTMDQNMEESDLQFQEEVEALNMGDDTVIVENNEQKEKKPKEKKKGKLKEKWQNLSKRTKIIIIVSSVIVLILIGVLLFFCLRKKDEKPVDNIPDVILEEDNYRYENGTLYFLDEDENDIGSYECENKDENTCYVAYLSNNDDLKGKIVIGTTRNIADNKLSEYLTKFYKKYPNVQVKIIIDSASNLNEYLIKHTIDILIDYLPQINFTEKSDMEIQNIGYFKTCFACSQDFYKEICNDINCIDDLKKYKLVIPGASRRRQELDEILQSSNIGLSPIIEMPDSKLMAEFIKNNNCIGYFIEEEIEEYNLKELKLKEELPKNFIGIVYPKNAINNIAKKFVELVLEK